MAERAAADDNDPMDVNEDDNNDLENLVDNALIPALINMAAAGNYDVESIIDREKALLLLEVTNNNVGLAAQLYWDDFLATQRTKSAGTVS